LVVELAETKVHNAQFDLRAETTAVKLNIEKYLRENSKNSNWRIVETE